MALWPATASASWFVWANESYRRGKTRGDTENRSHQTHRNFKSRGVEEGDQYATISGQPRLDEAANQISRRNFQQEGNLKHGRHFGKSFTKNASIQPEPKEVSFK